MCRPVVNRIASLVWAPVWRELSVQSQRASPQRQKQKQKQSLTTCFATKRSVWSATTEGKKVGISHRSPLTCRVSSTGRQRIYLCLSLLDEGFIHDRLTWETKLTRADVNELLNDTWLGVRVLRTRCYLIWKAEFRRVPTGTRNGRHSFYCYKVDDAATGTRN